MNLFVTKHKEFKAGYAWSQIEESTKLLKEFVDRAMMAKEDMPSNTSTEVDKMDVGTLRKHLDEANLELDGSREILVDRLANHRQNQDSNSN